MRRWFRPFGALLIVLSAAGASYAAARAASMHPLDPPRSNQGEPSAEPHDMKRVLREWGPKILKGEIERRPAPTMPAELAARLGPTGPKFVGELSGVRFVEAGDLSQAAINARLSSKCTTEGAGSNLRYVETAAAAAAASPVAFVLTYLPTGFSETNGSATACDDDVVSLTRVYKGARGATLSITRQRGTPVVQAAAPQETLTAFSAGTLMGVQVRYPGLRVVYHLRDTTTRWIVTCMALNETECERVIGGMR